MIFLVVFALFWLGYWILLGVLDFSIIIVALILTAACGGGIWYYVVYEPKEDEDVDNSTSP